MPLLIEILQFLLAAACGASATLWFIKRQTAKQQEEMMEELGDLAEEMADEDEG